MVQTRSVRQPTNTPRASAATARHANDGCRSYSVHGDNVRWRTEQLGRYRYVRISKFVSESNMSLGTILLVLLILVLLGVIPSWPHSRSWGYGPSGIVGIVLVVLVVLLIAGRI